MATALHNNGLYEAKPIPETPADKLARENALELERARGLNIACRADFERVTAEMVRLKTLRRAVDDTFNPIIEKQHAAHKEALAQKKKVADPLDQALNVLSPKVAAWLEFEEQERQAEQRRQLEAAREAAELEREQTIETAEAMGADTEEIAALCAMPLDVPAVTMSRPSTKGAPVILRETYKGVVENKLAFVLFVAKNPTYLNMLDINEAALNKMAAALKTAMNFPGVKVIKQTGTATYTSPRGAR